MDLSNIVLVKGFTFEIPFELSKIVITNTKVQTETNLEFAHVHPCYEIYIVTQGQINLHLNDEVKTLSAGELCWIAPGIRRYAALYANVPHQHVVITFDIVPNNQHGEMDGPLEKQELLTLIRYATMRPYWIVKDQYSGIHIMDLLNTELAAPMFGSYLKIRNIYSSFIVACAQSIFVTSELPDISEPFLKRIGGDDSFFNRAMLLVSYMHERYMDDISLQQAAEHLNITTRHVNRLANEYWGTTFGKILTTIRLGYAKLYLESTTLPVEQIAEKVGFSSPRVLYRHFKETEDTSITEYRQNSSSYQKLISQKT